MINVVIIIAALLVVFYGVVIMYHSSKFNPVSSSIPDIAREPEPVTLKYEPDIYKTQDTSRFKSWRTTFAMRGSWASVTALCNGVIRR